MKPLSAFADEQLAFRVRNGDERAFEELLRRHRDLVFFEANKFHARSESQDDIEQAARFGLYKAARTFSSDRGSGFRNFATLAVRSEIITFIKTAGRGKHRVLTDAARFEQPVPTQGGETVNLADVVPDPGLSTHDKMLAKERLAEVVSIMTEQCTSLQRTVVARRLNGLSLEECGRGLGRAVSPAKTADNALQKVRARLAA